MSSTDKDEPVDATKASVKEALGTLTGNDRLRDEGRKEKQMGEPTGQSGRDAKSPASQPAESDPSKKPDSKRPAPESGT